jgi:RNA polymerase sigma-70 factor (ECF subfamily)
VDGIDPEHEALLADSVGLALLVVLETLSPPERLAFVLHDIFAVPFDEIAPIVDRSPEGARQLASRARRRPRRENNSRRRPRNAVGGLRRVYRRSARRRLRSTRCTARPGRRRAGRPRLGRRLAGGARRRGGGAPGARPRPRTCGGHPAGADHGAAGVVASLDGQPFSIAAITAPNGKIAELDFFKTRSDSVSST